MTALIFDTETHKLHGDLIEAAFIGIDILPNSGLIRTQTEHSQRFKPSEPIHIGAMAVHHIIDEDLERCPDYTTFRFPENIDVQYLIGHNIDYDMDVLDRAGVPTQHIKRICTLAMARYIWPSLKTHTLNALAYYVSINRKQTQYNVRNAHNALVDCNTTFELLRAIMQTAELRTIEELYQFSESARIPTHIFYGKYKGSALIDLEVSQLDWIYSRSDDPYLLEAIEDELDSRKPVEELPFI